MTKVLQIPSKTDVVLTWLRASVVGMGGACYHYYYYNNNYYYHHHHYYYYYSYYYYYFYYYHYHYDDDNNKHTIPEQPDWPARTGPTSFFVHQNPLHGDRLWDFRSDPSRCDKY